MTNLSCTTSFTLDSTVPAGVDYIVGKTTDVGENDNEEQVWAKHHEVWGSSPDPCLPPGALNIEPRYVSR